MDKPLSSFHYCNFCSFNRYSFLSPVQNRVPNYLFIASLIFSVARTVECCIIKHCKTHSFLYRQPIQHKLNLSFNSFQFISIPLFFFFNLYFLLRVPLSSFLSSRFSLSFPFLFPLGLWRMIRLSEIPFSFNSDISTKCPSLPLPIDSKVERHFTSPHHTSEKTVHSQQNIYNYK